jgi:hypothetical protein
MSDTFDAPTNTAPGSSSGNLAPREQAGDDEWDFLDGDPSDKPPPGADETEVFTLDDDDGDEPPPDDKKTAVAAPDPDDKGKTEDKPAVEPDKPTTETPAALAPDVAAKVEYFETFDQALKKNPAAVLDGILASMDVRDRAAWLSAQGLEADGPAQLPDDYEPTSDMEAALMDRWRDIEAVPHLIGETKALDAKFTQHYDNLVPHIQEANINAQISFAVLEAFGEAIGVKFEMPDPAAIREALKDGRTTYRSAVRKVMEASLAKATESHKQAQVKRPQTPGNASRKMEQIPMGTDAVTIARMLGTLPRRG